PQARGRWRDRDHHHLRLRSRDWGQDRRRGRPIAGWSGPHHHPPVPGGAGGTGWRSLRAALASQPRLAGKTRHADAEPTAMKPAPFDYVRAATLAEAHAVLAAEGADARVIAGGQTLVPMLSMRLARPRVLVDVMGLRELGRIKEEEGVIRVGAAVRQARLLAWPQLAARQPMLAAALPWVGHAQTRNRGTVCGSIAHADPSAELPLALVALDGSVTLSTRWRRRRVAAAL